MFQQQNENFSFDDCAFINHKSKDSCSRVVMWREFNLINSYTCEASFCGPTKGSLNGCHFNTTHFENIGKSFCETLVEITENRERVKSVFQELQSKFPVNSQNKKSTYVDDD